MFPFPIYSHFCCLGRLTPAPHHAVGLLARPPAAAAAVAIVVAVVVIVVAVAVAVAVAVVVSVVIVVVIVVVVIFVLAVIAAVTAAVTASVIIVVVVTAFVLQNCHSHSVKTQRQCPWFDEPSQGDGVGTSKDQVESYLSNRSTIFVVILLDR